MPKRLQNLAPFHPLNILHKLGLSSDLPDVMVVIARDVNDSFKKRLSIRQFDEFHEPFKRHCCLIG